MKKWYDEEYEFTVEVVGFLRGNRTENYCRNGEEIGDRYSCTYGCPVKSEDQAGDHGAGRQHQRGGRSRLFRRLL